MTKALENITPQEKQLIQQAINKPFPALRQQIKSNLFFFIRYFWNSYSDEQFIPNWHIKEICKLLEEVAYRVANKEPKQYDPVINVPPGTTKTALVSVFFPIWCWVNWYWMKFITTSHSWPLSLESAEYSRDVIRSEKFKEIFPEIGIKQDKDQKSNFKVVKYLLEDSLPGQQLREKIGGGRISTSVDAKITGFHAHIIIMDDLIDPKGSISPAMLNTANRYIDQTLSTRKVDKEVSTMVMIMQRLSQNDPTGHLLGKEKTNVKHICLPGEIRNYRKYLKPIEYEKYYKDDLLDPVRMSWKVLHEMKADLGQYGYAGQIGQNPVPPGGGMFQVENISVVDKIPHESRILQVVRYWDKAGTEEGGAYTVGVKMAKLIENKFLVMDVKRGQWASNKREDIIKQTAEADGTNCQVYVEQEPGSGGKESAEATIRNLAGFSVYADRPTGDKANRADPYSVQINNGNVSLLYGPWNKAYLDELGFFPFSTYKDQVDASSGAFQKLVGRRDVKVHRRGG